MSQAYKEGGSVRAFEITAAIREYRLVKYDTTDDNNITECDSEEVSCGASIGAGTADGDVINIQQGGIAKVVAGGTITAGDFVNSDNDGKAVSESSTNKWASGKAVMAAVTGDVISVDLDMAGYISSS